MESNDPFSSPTNRVAASFRAKRDAAYAQLPDAESSARIKQKAQAFSSQMEKASLERRLLAAEAEKKELEVRLTQKERLVAKLEGDRRWLADREKEEREEKEEERREREEEKRHTATTLRTLRVELSTLREEHAELQEAHSALKRSTSQTISSQKTHLLELTRQAAVLEEELVAAREAHERSTQSLRTQLEEATLAQDAALPPRDDDNTWQVVRDELHRQASYLRTLESTNAQLTAEVLTLRERHMSAEVLREEKRALERKAHGADELRETVARLQAEVEAARAERERWAAEARGPPISVSQDLAELRLRNALLLEEHGAAAAALRRREAELADAVKKGEEATEYVMKLEEEVRELRHGGAGRERRLELAEREVGFLKALVASFAAEEQATSEEDDPKLQRIRNLEEVVDALKAENERLERELREQGGTGRGVRWDELSKSLDDERAAREALEKELTEAHSINTSTAAHLEDLEQTLFELRGDIASGAHVPPGTRVLALRDSPLQQATDLRQAALDRLKNENDALLKRVGELEATGAGAGAGMNAGDDHTHLVPRESWEKERKEKSELEEALRQREKRLLRLQQVFTSKAQEFRDAMSSILGYKLHFSANGQVRVTSQYDVSTSFVFQPADKQDEGDGEGGTKMQLVGAGDSRLPDLARTVEYWVGQRMCIPGLMASVTLECYDQTKRGREQAWGVSA